jgi:hypothetical protein
MKKILSVTALLGVFLLMQSCDTTQAILQNLPSQTTQALTEGEIGTGLKDALNVGITNGVNELIKTDGYLGNQLLKITLPLEVKNVQDKITKNVPQSQQLLDNLVVKMNRAAEDAANEAKPIFIDAITSMTITDAKNILFGGEGAATNYLKQKTLQQLTNAYLPKINNSLSKVGATQAWSALTNPYNKIARSPAGALVGVTTPINADLGNYVTQKALDGVFIKVSDEENKIRKNPIARTTAMLQKVFGELDKK